MNWHPKLAFHAAKKSGSAPEKCLYARFAAGIEDHATTLRKLLLLSLRAVKIMFDKYV